MTPGSFILSSLLFKMFFHGPKRQRRRKTATTSDGLNLQASSTPLSPPQPVSNKQDAGLSGADNTQHHHPRRRVVEFKAFFPEIAQQEALLDGKRTTVP